MRSRSCLVCRSRENSKDEHMHLYQMQCSNPWWYSAWARGPWYIYPFPGHWGNPIQNAIDLCTPRHQNPKLRSLKSVTEGLEISKFYLKSFKLDSTNAWRKRRAEKFRNTRIATFVFSIYRLGYGTFQEIFLENVATFFYFLQNFVRPADLRGPPWGLGGLAHRRGSVLRHHGRLPWDPINVSTRG